MAREISSETRRRTVTGGLQNRVALITGWASGIGQAIAIEFAKEGTDVM